MTERQTLFISYSHKDAVWKDRLLEKLEPVIRSEAVQTLHDGAIEAGADWYDSIVARLETTAVAVLLLSPDFLASDFVLTKDLPSLLAERAGTGMPLLFVVLRPCLWTMFPWPQGRQVLPRDGLSIAEFEDPASAWAEVVQAIRSALEDRWRSRIVRQSVAGVALFSRLSRPERLVGRERELRLLDEVWDQRSARIFTLVGWGGSGKTSVVAAWLERLSGGGYRGARRVYAWSFYGQGTRGQAIGNKFVTHALEWFGDGGTGGGSRWERGERLARLVLMEPTIVVLDGLETLQSNEGRILDTSVESFVTALAREQSGLCVITSRVPLSGLPPSAAVHRMDLEQLTSESARALLRLDGVQGSDADLEAIAQAFGNHALSLRLAAAAGKGASIARIMDVVKGEKPGTPSLVNRLIDQLAERLGPERELLSLIGLFDRPASVAALDALQAPPVIPGLTETLHGSPSRRWQDFARSVERVGLLTWATDGGLDAHPIVREYFAARLREYHRAAWQAGHQRLYEHFRSITKDQPSTLEEMEPLYEAMLHGCRAELYQEVLDEVYWPRVLRGQEGYSLRQLGTFAEDLAALSNFFEIPFTKPVGALRLQDRKFVLAQTGLCLRALGRLSEAGTTFRAILGTETAEQNWHGASIAAIQSSEVSLIGGRISTAVEMAEWSRALSDRTADAALGVAARVQLATSLHQRADTKRARSLFAEAEALQAKWQPEFPLLYSVSGFRYCALLLDLGEFAEVERRARLARSWASRYLRILDVALADLSLGQVALFSERVADPGDPSTAHLLASALEGLRRAGTRDFLALGLLARGELNRRAGAFELAGADFDEAMAIADRDGMFLLRIDCLLAQERLCTSVGQADDASKKSREAHRLIEATGYLRRLAHEAKDDEHRA